MTAVPDAVRQLVRERASDRCEYCLFPADQAFQPHEVDHIFARKHRGSDDDSNLCLSCFPCNRHKGSDLASFDPVTGDVALLFHPRRDRWHEHFEVRGSRIEGITPSGRATVELLQFNTLERILEREPLIVLGRYP
jgi:hypothetical protein